MTTHLRRTALVRGLVLTTALVVGLGACGSGDATAPEQGAQTGATSGAHAGGSIVYGIAGDPICVDPNQTDLTASRDILRQVADSVVDADPDTGEIVPWLATAWEVNDDATQFDFTLRTDVTFSDGEAFDATAFKTFLDGVDALGGKAINASSYLDGYAGTEVVAADHARVTFSAPHASFLQELSTVNLAVLAPATYTSTSAEDRCLGKIIGSGAYTLDSFTPAQEVVLSARDDYDWPSANAEHEGRAYLDQITFRVVPEAGVRSGGLSSGDLDGINSVARQDELALSDAGFTVLSTNNPGTVSEYLTNNSSPVLKDPAVRKAIQIGIDRQQIKDTLLLPRNNIATSILSSTTPYYTDFSQYIYTDTDEAKKLLDDAGWVPGADGIRAKDGLRLSVNVVNGQSGGTDREELVAQQLAQIGVELTITNVSRAEMLAALDSGDYDFVPYGFTRADPAALTMHFSTLRNNPLHLQPSVLDDYLAQQAAATDPAARQEAVDDAAEYILKNNLVIVFTEQSSVHTLNPALKDVHWEPGAQLTFYDAWLDE